MLVQWTLYDDDGAPITTATPSFVDYVDRSLASRPFPNGGSIANLGGGTYGFESSPADDALGVAYLITNGPGANPARVSGAVYLPTGPFGVWHLEDDTGALWLGAAPIIPAGAYTWAGGALSSPAVLALRTYLLAVTPSAAELALGVSFRAASPTGAFPDFFHQTLRAQLVTLPSTTTPPTPISTAAGFEDMADVIALTSTGAYQVTRPGLATFIDGVRVPATPTVFGITACVQPWSGRDFGRLPDGFRDAEKLALWTTTELLTAGPTTEPDLVNVNGLPHQVAMVKRWSEMGNFFAVTLVRPA